MSTFRYQHLRTNNPGSEPSPSLIREGEIAVNIAKDNEKIFLKNTEDEIIKFIPESQIDAKIASQSGSTDAKVSALTNSVNAVSGAVNALDTKVDGISSATNTALATKVDSSAYSIYTSTTNTVIASKANSADVYGKSETYTKTEVDTKITNDTNNFFDTVKYEESGTTHVISFYHGNTLKGTVDAAPFIKDGMVEDVEIETIDGVTYLIISFNTDAGKQDIRVPITTIFNPTNYYTKQEVDDLVEDEERRAKAAEDALTTNLANEITARTKAVSDEKTRAEAAESDLSDAITAETSARQTAISDEKNRAEAAESDLSDAITAETSARQTAVSNEETRAKAAESALTNSLNELSGKAITEIASKNNSLEISTASTSNGTVKADIKTDASKISGLTAVADSNQGAAKISGVTSTDSVKKGIENLYKSIASEVAARKAAIAARTIASNNKGITVTETPNADGFNTTIELTLDTNTNGTGSEKTGNDNALTITDNGLFLSTNWTCGEF